jgi:flagellar FliL protein
MTTTMTSPPVGTEEVAPPKSRKKLLLVALVLLLVGGAAWYLLKPSSVHDAPEPGVVVKLDAIQVNLAAGHYLRIGIALQASKDAGAEVDGSKALDATIDLFSGRPVEELSRKGSRTDLKRQLEQRLDEVYEGEVIGVYFTDFVTQ